jgi:hypothetical protein
MEVKTYLIKVYETSTGQITVHQLKAEKGLHPENRNVIWDIEFDFFGDIFRIKGEYFLSAAMDKIRETIEPKGYRALVKCADYDAAHSGMQADMSAGTKIFKLSLVDGLKKRSDSKKNPIIEATFHVFDESDIASVTTLQKQRHFRADYFDKKRIE